jgi:hypothetical protein
VSGAILESMEDAVAAVKRISALPRELVRRAFERRFTAARMAADYVSAYEALLARNISSQRLRLVAAE